MGHAPLRHDVGVAMYMISVALPPFLLVPRLERSPRVERIIGCCLHLFVAIRLQHSAPPCCRVGECGGCEGRGLTLVRPWPQGPGSALGRADRPAQVARRRSFSDCFVLIERAGLRLSRSRAQRLMASSIVLPTASARQCSLGRRFWHPSAARSGKYPRCYAPGIVVGDPTGFHNSTGAQCRGVATHPWLHLHLGRLEAILDHDD